MTERRSGPGIEMWAQRNGQNVVGQILTDEELRAELLERPHATHGELDALVQTIAGWGEQWIDPRRQRCRLTRGRAD